jgi:hypothetical protein
MRAGQCVVARAPFFICGGIHMSSVGWALHSSVFCWPSGSEGGAGAGFAPYRNQLCYRCCSALNAGRILRACGCHVIIDVKCMYVCMLLLSLLSSQV